MRHLLILAVLAACEDKAVRTLQIGSTGVAVHIRDGPAFDRLFAWSRQLGDRGATHGEASEREGQVHALIASGAWPSHAWDEYQRLAAGSGQVDSGGLLRDYGVAFSVAEHAPSEPLVRAAVEGDVGTARRLLEDYLSEAPLPDGTTALHAAALANSEAVAKLLLDRADDARAFLESRGAHGLTALHTAASANALQVLEELTRRGAVVDARHAFANSTALHFAAEEGHADIIRALCNAGADADASTTLGGRPLHAAAQKGHVRAVEALLACGCNTETLLNEDTTPLYLAALEGHAAVVRALVAGGASLTPTITYSAGAASKAVAFSQRHDWRPNAEPGNGATPLHAAAEHGHADVVEELLEAGAPVDDRSMSGVSPLHLASGYGRGAVIRLLVERGATVDLGDRTGATPLSHSVASAETVAQLLAFGADPNAPRRDGATAVHAAVSLGNAPVVRALVAHGGRAATRTRDGATPLLVAATDDALIDALQNASDFRDALAVPGPGAVASIVSHSREERAGDAPLTVAVRKGARKAAQLLLDLGADPNAISDDSGCVPLHFAANNDDGHLVQVLVKAGALVDVGSDQMDGAAPLYIAATRGAVQAAAALLDAGADPDRATEKSETALLAAVERDAIGVIRALLSPEAEEPVRVADPNKGSTSSSVHQAPLLLAVARGRVEAAAALLEAGANCAVLVAATAGDPPENLIDVARHRRDHAMLQLLMGREDECDVSLEDMD